jgi:hypothetical protein
MASHVSHEDSLESQEEIVHIAASITAAKGLDANPESSPGAEN